MILKAYKYRIYPTKDQVVLFNKTFGCVRMLWNTNVAIFNSYNKETNPNPTYKSSTEIRSCFEWMKEISASALQQKEIDFKNFKKNYFSKTRKSKVGKCSFKIKSDRQSYRLPNQKFTLKNHKIRLEKIGWVDCKIDRRPSKKCKFISVTVSRDKVGKFFVSILTQETNKIIKPTGKSVGIDLGLKDFVITSDGDKVVNPKYFRENQTRLRKAKNNFFRKKKGSIRYNKCKIKIARIYSKITNQRKWFLHQVSNDLINNYDFIGLEDLNIKKMVKNNKLAKYIKDVSWGNFIRMLEYKSNWNDKQIFKIGRFFPSSRLCSNCGWIKHDLNLSDRNFICELCGVYHDRDFNASINILNESLRISAQGVACA